MRISQLWSRCTLEQYDYAQGVGIVAWRALGSGANECNGIVNIARNKQYKKFTNYFANNLPENFYVMHEENFDRVNDSLNTVSINGRAKNDYELNGLFIDDHIHYFTGNSSLLNFLRKEQPQQKPTKPVEPLPEIQASISFANTTDRQFLEKAYQLILKRLAEDGAYRFWLPAITSLGRTKVLASIFASEESKVKNHLSTNERFVIGLYRILLFRDPDNEGKLFW